MNETEAKVAELQGQGAADSAAPNIPRKRGRPPGSKNKPKGPPVENVETEKVSFVYVRDENQVKASALLGSTVWALASKMLPVRTLTQDESMALGEALDPVLQKYLPIFGAFKYEINLVVVIFQLYYATREEKKKPAVVVETEETNGNP